jgi:hypothetical protein
VPAVGAVEASEERLVDPQTQRKDETPRHHHNRRGPKKECEGDIAIADSAVKGKPPNED